MRILCIQVFNVTAISGICSGGLYARVLTGGWKTGSRVRERRFYDVYSLYCYLNKVRNTGYMSDSEYSESWSQALKLESSCMIPLGFPE